MVGSGIDPTTFDWVSREIRASLRDAQSSLDIYQQSAAANPTAMRVCANHIHQIVGTFQMVELDTLARLAMEIERVAEVVADGDLDAESAPAGPDEIVELLATSLAQINTGLDRVERGEPELPLHKATLMNQLRVARGAEQLEMHTLFSPDLDVFPAISNKPVIDDDEYRSFVKVLRRRFQLALLGWLKQSGEASADDMQHVVAEFYELARFSDVVRLWWIARAYIDVVGLQPGESARNHAPVFRELDEKMHELVVAGERSLIQGACDDLVKRMLYTIGMAARADHSTYIREVYDAYNLQSLFRIEDAEEPDSETNAVSEALSRLGERVHIDMPYVQHLMTQFFDDHEREVRRLQPIVEQIDPLIAHADELGVGLLGELAREIVETIAYLEHSDPSVSDEDTAFQLATALMYIDHSLGGELVPDEDWRSTLESRISGMRGLRGPGSEDKPYYAEAGDSERLKLLKIVESEVSSTLAEIEVKLEAYEKDTSEVALLADVPTKFEHVRGVLLIAGEQKLGLLLSLAAEQSNKLYEREAEPTHALLEALAVATGAAQAFVQGLHSRQAERDELLERAISDLEKAAGMRVTRADVEELIGNSTESLNSWLNEVSDFAVLTRLRRNLRDISRLSSDTGLDKVVELVEEENQLLDLVANDPALLDSDVKATLKDSMACITELLIELYGTEDSEGDQDAAERDIGHESAIEQDDLLMIHDEMEEFVPDEEGKAGESVIAAGAGSSSGIESGSADTMSPLYDEDLREVFISEASENLRVIGEWLEAPGGAGGPDAGNRVHSEEDAGFPDSVYVAVHTLKGNSRALELNGIADAYSAADDLLAYLAIDQKPLDEPGLQALADLRNETGKILTDLQNGQIPETEADNNLVLIAAIFTRILNELDADRPNEPGDDGIAAVVPRQTDAPVIKDLLPDEVQRELSDTPVAVSDGEQSDPDDIFCEDALRILDRIETLLPQMDDPGRCREAYTGIGNELDTLKGSARVAGVNEIGDLAHAGESYLDTILQKNDGMVEGAAEQLQEIHRTLAAYVGFVQRGQPISADLDLLEKLTGPQPGRELPFDPTLQSGSDPDDDFTRELVGVFCEEAFQVLARIEATLERWLDLTGWRDASESLQRDLHTLKGGARMAGASVVADLTHEAESLIDWYSPGDQAEDRLLQRLFQELHDVLLTDVHRLEADLSPHTHDDLLAQIIAYGHDDQRGTVAASATPPVDPSSDQDLEAGGEGEYRDGTTEPTRSPAMRIDTGTLDRLSNYAGDVSVSRSQMAEEMVSLKETLERLRRSTASLNDQLQDLELQASTALVSVDPPDGSETGLEPHSGEFDSLELDRYTHLQRLSRDLLESMDELGNIESTLNIYAHRVETSLQQQDRVNQELQDQIMRVRMVPFGGIASQLRHIARQAARQLDKDVELIVLGGEVELDKSVLEGVTEALEHMVRNAVDHGIETREDRLSDQKPSVGKVEVECSQLGREILIRVSDDGRGLAVERLNAIAVDKGIIQSGETLDNDRLLALISATGFSSRDEVTQLSGRGVGMGAVGETLRRLGGNLELVHTEGPGTTFLLRLPVSLAITRAMYFRVGTHEYAASMRTIERVVNIDADKIEELRQESEPVLEDRGEHFSVIDLRDYLGHTRGPSREGPLPVLLVRAGSQNIAVVADEVTDNREIVVKPLGEHLASIPIYSGGSIRADGSVILVLDFIGMAYAETAVTVDQRVRDGERVEAPQVLVVDDSLTVRKAAQRDLAACGIKVSTATDGIDAQRFLEERTPDLILLDIEMPGMDGYEFLEWLRESDIKDIPVTVISSRSTEKYRQKAFELGAADFLAKPYRIADLMDIIHTRLGYEIEERGTETDG